MWRVFGVARRWGVGLAMLALLLAPAAAEAQDLGLGQQKPAAPRKRPAPPPAKKAPPKAPAAPAPTEVAPTGPATSEPATSEPQAAPQPRDAAARLRANPFPGDERADSDARHTSADALAFFRQELSPHGSWTDHPEHGTVWIPDPAEVGSDFAPYRTNGRWAVDTDGNWNWLSGYPWGKLPFHFGRWTWLGKSWGWVPDTEYAPAWVVWRVSKRDRPFVGWGPMAPTHRWVDGKRELHPGTRALPFWFVSVEHLFDPRVSTFVVGDPRIGARMHRHTTILDAHDAAGGASGASRLRGPARVRNELLDRLGGLDPSRALLAASPTFEQAHVPPAAQPPERIAPLDPRHLLPAGLLDGAPKSGPAAAPPEPTKSAAADERSRPERARRALRSQLPRRFVRRCVHTSRGRRCWTYRWPPRWRGR